MEDQDFFASNASYYMKMNRNIIKCAKSRKTVVFLIHKKIFKAFNNYNRIIKNNKKFYLTIQIIIII